MGASPPGPGKISSSLFKVSSASVISMARKVSFQLFDRSGADDGNMSDSPGTGEYTSVRPLAYLNINVYFRRRIVSCNSSRALLTLGQMVEWRFWVDHMITKTIG